MEVGLVDMLCGGGVKGVVVGGLVVIVERGRMSR